METGVALSIGQIISIIGLAVSIYFNSKSAKHTEDKDKEDREERAVATATAMTEMNMTLRNVAKNVEAIMTELCDTKDQVADLNLRVTIVESGLKDTAREVNEIRDKGHSLSVRIADVNERVAKLE